MTLNDGDVVRFDYTLYLDGKAVETSMEDVAHEHGLPHHHGAMKPLTLVIGQRQIIAGLEEELVAKPEGSYTVEIPAAKAYGERDPNLVSMMPMARFKKMAGQAPQPGMALNMEGRRAIVTRVMGGRVQIDANHDLAGKDLTYDVVVREVVSDEAAKVQAVLETFFMGAVPVASFEGDVVSLEIPDQAKFDQQWPMHKFRLIAQLRGVTSMDKDIRLIETYPANPVPPTVTDDSEE